MCLSTDPTEYSYEYPYILCMLAKATGPWKDQAHPPAPPIPFLEIVGQGDFVRRPGASLRPLTKVSLVSVGGRDLGDEKHPREANATPGEVGVFAQKRLARVAVSRQREESSAHCAF